MGNQVARTATRTSSDMTLTPNERNDRWLTPKPIIDALTVDIGLPKFDLDPCGAPGHDTASKVFTLEKGDDGLRDSWVIPWSERSPGRLGRSSRVWMNPAYGQMKLQWIDRFLGYYRAGAITGTMLIPYDPGQVHVWQERMAREASAIFAYRHRIDFWGRDNLVGNMPTGKRMQSVTESALVAFGQEDADALWEATTRNLIPGWLTDYTGKVREQIGTTPLPHVVQKGVEAAR